MNNGATARTDHRTAAVKAGPDLDQVGRRCGVVLDRGGVDRRSQGSFAR
jgi:hypothetical protein